MYKPKRHSINLIKIINNTLIDLPTPSSISTWWNFGSLLGLCLTMQMITGMLIAMHYYSDPQVTFMNMVFLSSNVNTGWLLRHIHANGASLFFIFLYLHVGRGLYSSSYKMSSTWTMGMVILLTTMATAFLGYVLPWGQMSFWGATVITNLVSTIPYIGNKLITWLWGGFAISKPTLARFFTLHFTLPFIITTMVVMHIFFLHTTGSSNPLGLDSNMDKLPFHPFFTSSDSMGFIVAMLTFTLLNLSYPFILNDPDNFVPANPLSTPAHIQPEWYFLFAYAILRSIPNKLGGVIALTMSIMILTLLPTLESAKFSSKNFYPINQLMFWLFILNIVLLTWIGAHPVEAPFILMGQSMTCIYFSFFFINPLMSQWWEKSIE